MTNPLIIAAHLIRNGTDAQKATALLIAGYSNLSAELERASRRRAWFISDLDRHNDKLTIDQLLSNTSYPLSHDYDEAQKEYADVTRKACEVADEIEEKLGDFVVADYQESLITS